MSAGEAWYGGGRDDVDRPFELAHQVAARERSCEVERPAFDPCAEPALDGLGKVEGEGPQRVPRFLVRPERRRRAALAVEDVSEPLPSAVEPRSKVPGEHVLDRSVVRGCEVAGEQPLSARAKVDSERVELADEL